MTETLSLRTNLNCQSCVAAVKPYLDRATSIASWEVDVASPDKTLTVHGPALSKTEIREILAQAGFEVMGESASPKDAPEEDAADGRPTAATYYPLLLIVAFLLGVVALTELVTGEFMPDRAMRSFMGGFFLAFSFFKLLDLRGFADSFGMYDVLAQRVRAYGYAYPFIELALGIAYLTGFQPTVTNGVTIVVMSIGAVGVLRSLIAKRRIRCACLGTTFNLPMSTVTLIEDSLMAAMATVMVVAGSHA